MKSSSISSFIMTNFWVFVTKSYINLSLSWIFRSVSSYLQRVSDFFFTNSTSFSLIHSKSNLTWFNLFNLRARWSIKRLYSALSFVFFCLMLRNFLSISSSSTCRAWRSTFSMLEYTRAFLRRSKCDRISFETICKSWMFVEAKNENDSNMLKNRLRFLDDFDDELICIVDSLTMWRVFISNVIVEEAFKSIDDWTKVEIDECFNVRDVIEFDSFKSVSRNMISSLMMLFVMSDSYKNELCWSLTFISWSKVWERRCNTTRTKIKCFAQVKKSNEESRWEVVKKLQERC